MEFNDYQEQVRNFVDYPVEIGPFSVIYGIMSDTGTLAYKLRGILEEKHGEFNDVDKVKIQITLGDILRNISNIASDLNISLEEVAAINLRKLALQKEKQLEAKETKKEDNT